MRSLTLALFLIFQFNILSQQFTLSGNIKDAENGEDLIGASIYVKNKKEIGTISNIYGYYSLSLEKGAYTIIFNYIGYKKMLHAPTLQLYAVKEEPISNKEVRSNLKEWISFW